MEKPSKNRVSGISILNGKWFIGEYCIAGNYDDGYTVWKADDGEDSDTLYSDISFEKCMLWCIRIDKR